MDGSARLTGPVAGPPEIIMTGFDLGQAGYTVEEFLLESTATRFQPAGPAGAAGFVLAQDVEEMVAVASAAYPAR